MENGNGIAKKRKRKPRPIDKNPFKYFHFVQTEVDEKDPCLVKKMYLCELCNETYCGTKKSNLKSHLQTRHKKEYIELANGESFEVQRLRLLQNLVEMISVNGRPFQSLHDSGFQKIIKEKLDCLQKNGHGINLSDPNLKEIKDHLSQTSKKIQKKISVEVKHQIVGLMVDIVTKNNRSILGVSIQYVFKDQLRIRSIGMMELKESHTAVYLSKMIIERLKRYDINLQQIIVLTTGNGENVCKMVRDVEDNLQKDINAATNDASNNEIEENIDEEIASILASTTDIEEATPFSIIDDVESLENTTLLNSISRQIHDDGVQFLFDITGVHCAQHTLQLAIKDSLKQTSNTVKNMIELCRRACKIFRLNSTSIEIENAGVKYIRPRLENDTRWGTLYLMLMDILKCEEMVKYFAENKHDKMFQMLLKMWAQLKEIIYLLRILCNTTIAFQQQKLTLSDVYGHWLTTQLHLKQCINKKSYKTGFAQCLYDALDQRKEGIFDNDLMYAAIFLDPRFHTEIATNELKMERAKAVLVKIWRRMNILNAPTELMQSNKEKSTNSLSFEFNPDVALAQHLANDNKNDASLTHSTQEKDIEEIIDNYQPDAMPFSTSVIKFWQSIKQDNPELYQLACVIFSVPPTEVQIERDFSSLNFVFTNRRCSISSERLEEIMLIHLNRDLFEEVNCEDIAMIIDLECKITD